MHINVNNTAASAYVDTVTTVNDICIGFNVITVD